MDAFRADGYSESELKRVADAPPRGKARLLVSEQKSRRNFSRALGGFGHCREIGGGVVMADEIKFDPEKVELNAAKLVIVADDLSTAANKPEVCSAYTGIDVSWTNEFHTALQAMTAKVNEVVRGTQAQAVQTAQAFRETKQAFEEQENVNIDDFKFFEASTPTAASTVPTTSPQAGTQPGDQGSFPSGKTW